jgi:eukaryotic-like serine/threonine-protein kinase
MEPSASTVRPALPERVGPYAIEHLIGRGSAGAVYLAHDLERQRALAIKTLVLGPDEHARAQDRMRFEREVLAVRRLAHPGIVELVASGEEAGLAWVAMAFAPGHDLSRHVAAGALLQPGVVLDIGAQLAAALAHAHRQGVVHRDIKPGNVIFDPATGLARLTDFGIARLADASRTRTGVVLGTPAYMAPEQIAGLAVDGRADLYALGVLLFQLLCARLPFEAPTLGALMQRIAREPAPDLRVLRPDLPEAASALLARALAKRPAERPADGDAMARALREIAGQA